MHTHMHNHFNLFTSMLSSTQEIRCSMFLIRNGQWSAAAFVTPGRQSLFDSEFYPLFIHIAT